MAYLGRGLDKISNIEVLDNITFDGSSSYSITKGSVAFTPNSAQSCLISIDGVVQATNFTVSSSTIDFGVAIPSTSVCNFFLHYGTGVMTVPSDGSVTTAKLGDGAVTSSKLGAGKILQVIQTVKDAKFTTTSTSFTDVTGLSASITPSSSSNKVLVTASFCSSQGTNSAVNMFNLVRGSTTLGQPAVNKTFTSTRTQYTNLSDNIDTVHLQFLDSPSSTSATTYKIQAKCNGGTLIMGTRSSDDAEQISIITLMEVSA